MKRITKSAALRIVTAFSILLLLNQPGMSVCWTAETEASEVNMQDEVRSPDGRLAVRVFVDDHQPFYCVDHGDRPLIEKSRLGVQIKGLDEDAAWEELSRHGSEIRATWNPVWGKRSTVENRCNELVVRLASREDEQIRMDIVARVHDDGVAIRYILDTTSDGTPRKMRIVRDLTEFRFAADGAAWFYNGEHCPAGPDRLAACEGRRRVPMTIRSDSGLYLAVHEAALSDFCWLSLVGRAGEPSFEARVAEAVVTVPFELPWRVLMVSETPGGLVDSDILTNLNPPCAIEETSWIRPGVTFWDWRAWGHRAGDFVYGLDLPSWKRFVDLAAEAGIPYLLLDADWYGPEFDRSSDPVKGGKTRDVKEIIRYGKKRGIGIFLYLNDASSREFDLEDVLRNYAGWGAAGIKYGFMKAVARNKVKKTQRIIELCARHRLLCNFHDGPVHPTGGERTWPNCLTSEFCHSQSDAHRAFTPDTFCLQVYVNMLAGPLDMCNGLLDMTHSLEQRPKIFQQVDSTVTAEAARTLIVYSGLTVLPDSADAYRAHPRLLDFVAAQRMPWAESRTVAGEIGEFIVMMRRSGDTCLLGACTNSRARTLDIPLNFLGPGGYDAVICEDTPETHFRTNRESYRVRELAVDRSTALKLVLAPGGGACVTLKRSGPER